MQRDNQQRDGHRQHSVDYEFAQLAFRFERLDLKDLSITLLEKYDPMARQLLRLGRISRMSGKESDMALALSVFKKLRGEYNRRMIRDPERTPERDLEAPIDD